VVLPSRTVPALALLVAYGCTRPNPAYHPAVHPRPDTTDEPVFPVIPEFGGLGFSVGRRIPGVPGHFDRPHDVRRWLEILAVGTTP